MHRTTLLITFFFVCAIGRPIFRKSIYDGPEGSVSTRFTEPIVNSDSSNIHLEHMSTRSVGVDSEGNDLVVNMNYVGDLTKDTPIIKLDLIMDLNEISCVELSDDGSADLRLQLDFSDLDSAKASARYLTAGALVIAGHEWGCAHKKGNVVLMKLIADATLDASDAPVLSLQGMHVNYEDFFENLALDFSTNTYGTRSLRDAAADGTTGERHLDAQACPMFRTLDRSDTPGGIFGFIFNVLDQLQDLISGVQALISGLATLADTLANDWEGNGLTYSRTLGFNWDADTGSATCELPLVYDPSNETRPILSCTNCYGYLSASLSVAVDIQGFRLNSANISLSGESEVNVQMDLAKSITLSGTWSELFFDETPITAPITFMVGPVPIFIQPFLTMVVGAAVEMELTSSISAAVNQRNEAEFGIQYTDGVPTITERFDVGKPTSRFDVDADAARLHMAADIETLVLISVNYLGGPTASLKPFAEAEVQAVVDSSEYCARKFDASWMADLKIGLNAALGGELGPKFLDRPIEFSVFDELLDYKPVQSGCITGRGTLEGNPVLHDSTWVGTMTSCSLQEEVPIEVILRDMVDGQSTLEVIFNHPCTHVGRFQGGPINKVDQSGVAISPSPTALLQEGSEIECATTFSAYDHLSSPTVQVPISAEAVLRDMILTFSDNNMLLEGVSADGCNTWTAEYGREFVLYDRSSGGSKEGTSMETVAGAVVGSVLGLGVLAACCCCLVFVAAALAGLAVVGVLGATKRGVGEGGAKDVPTFLPHFITATTFFTSRGSPAATMAEDMQASPPRQRAATFTFPKNYKAPKWPPTKATTMV